MAARFKEHQLLLIRRESRVVVGRNAVNLWLLVLVLVATFLAIAFANGSIRYLQFKMSNPFTNWVDVYRGSVGSGALSIEEVRDSLDDTDKKTRFLYDGIQTEVNASLNLITANNKSLIFSSLYYEDMTCDLIKAILSPDNLVRHGACIPLDELSEQPIGLILSKDALRRLGYDEKHIPPYISYSKPYEGNKNLGYEIVQDEYVRVPLPILAVVNRLPMKKEVIASMKFYEYYKDDGPEGSFNMEYEGGYIGYPLYFFVPESITDFSEVVKQIMPDSLNRSSDLVLEAQESVQEPLRGWMPGSIYNVYAGDRSTPKSSLQAVANTILKHYAQTPVTQVYSYRENTRELSGEIKDVLSIHFASLDNIRTFERYIKDISGLEIEMSQVEARENFNAVSRMANILTAALIVFAIVCIIIFIANMQQSYFQKVRRNLGTFKAFGISTRELMGVYIVIIIGIVLAALAIALTITWLIQLLLPVFGVMKDGEYSYFLLWNGRTLWAITIIIVATLVTVYVVMQKLLRQTPGDLIYERK